MWKLERDPDLSAVLVVCLLLRVRAEASRLTTSSCRDCRNASANLQVPNPQSAWFKRNHHCPVPMMVPFSSQSEAWGLLPSHAE